ncbi:pyridine nucleotide-disulfide oxidoreductase family protein [Cladophialophora carrionii]|uniref:Pyridine nucleotide-disulfide oxidoreductase family protein n=1 Tax=Cladophialophora carrionii TaxID=86049 RepID=A0A1C1CBN8_9EURO|nr:pyridine nucleotide-disulfide oxidoreductase family protein [Cladophialophora carrionii]
MKPLTLRASLLPRWQRQLESTIHQATRARTPGPLRHRYDVQKRWLATSTDIAQDANRDPNDRREKVVILGSGWAGYVLARELDKRQYRVVVVSPRTYFVFTPLLNDTTVGTLEFRHVLESIRKPKSGVEFIQGWADDINFADKTVTIEPSVLDPDVGHALTGPRKQNEQQTNSGLDIKSNFPHGPWEKKVQMGGTGSNQVPTFPIHYDKLVIAVGTYSQTFGTKGVRENAWFLKDVRDAVAIRRRILELFELALLPIMPEETKKHLLHFAIVGGGPTGMEFAACLSDLIREDISKLHPHLMKYVRISLYDVAPKVLPMFDASLADYAVKQYRRQNIEIKTSHQVEELRKGLPNDENARNDQASQVKGRVYTIRTKQEGDVGIGMCVWSTGNMNNPFVAKALDHVRRYPTGSAQNIQGEVADPMQRQWIIERDAKTGVLLVDDHFRVNLTTECAAGMEEHDKPKAYMKDVFALGDSSKLMSGALPATAQVANQQAIWLGRTLNKHPRADSFARAPGFSFKDMGVLTYLGGSSAIFQGANPNGKDGVSPKGLKGLSAYLVWRGAYLSMTLSWRNRLNVAWQWLTVKIFGRDVSRF